MSKECVPLIFVPGSGGSIPESLVSSDGQVDYRPLDTAFKDAGFRPVYIQPDWQYETASLWESDVVAAARRLPSGVLAGFSYGALIALRAATRLADCRGVAAIEPSCVFWGKAELDGQLVDLEQAHKELHPDVMDYWRGYHEDGSLRFLPGTIDDLFNQGVPDTLNCPLQVYANTAAVPLMQTAARHVAKLYAGSTLVEFTGTHHLLTQPATVEAVGRNIGRLLAGGGN